MPRLFTGLEVPADVAASLELIRGGIPGARWVEREDYHITLRFIGDIDDRTAGEIAAELDAVASEPFDLQLTGIAAFGGNKPHALYAGVAASEALQRLQYAHERLCQTLGLAPEPRKFKPHVTLARLKSPPLDTLHGYLAAHSLYRSRAFEVERFVLFSARPLRGGGPYAVEEAYELSLGI